MGFLRQDGGSFVEQFYKAKVETVQKIVLATIALHNYLRQTDTISYCPAGFVDSFDGSGSILPGEWRRITSADKVSGAFCSLPPSRGSRYRNYAMEVTEALKAFVNSEQGTVSWQWEYIRRGVSYVNCGISIKYTVSDLFSVLTGLFKM